MNKLTREFNSKMTKPVGLAQQEREALEACQYAIEELLTDIGDGIYNDTIDLGTLDIVQTYLQDAKDLL